MELRERIIDDLSRLYAEDRLSEDEFETRVAALTRTEGRERLLALNADILPPERYAAPARQPMASPDSSDERRDLVGIFSGSSLKGIFDCPGHISAAAIFGGVDIDLRKAAIPADGVTIEVAAIFGGVDIRLPDHVRVVCDGVAIFGGIEKPASMGDPAGPLVRIQGTAIFGGVDVKFPRLSRHRELDED